MKLNFIRALWFVLGGAAFFLAALLLKLPQEAVPSTVPEDVVVTAAPPPVSVESADPHSEGPRGKGRNTEFASKDGGESENDQSVERPAKGETDSPSNEAGSEPAESDHKEVEAAQESPPPGKPLGDLSREAIDDGVRDQMPEIRECYQGWLTRNPDLEGTIQVKFVIATSEEDPDLGYVRSVEIADTTMGNVWMEGCVLSVMEDAEFEAPGNGVVIVRYPFKFNSEED